MQEKGFFNYIADVTIPSVTIYSLNRQGKLPYAYYSYPFEAEADRLGGVTNRVYNGKILPDNEYKSYWDLIELF